ncbi:F-box/LRR-repeat protein 13-like isoform X2 [Cicer arietinum]|uniref:F-box/LRR-repeat protein 13-like isoform X2 n=1 Tax=Cicer arietinum TaxID=3827 RepID=UPI003CC604E4
MKTENKEKNNDMISDLPDCVLLYILSLLNTKDAVQTCILSTRWKNLWKNLPTLRLNSTHLETFQSFAKFVYGILSLRDSTTSLHILDFHRSGIIWPSLLKKILKYAVSHNVQRLNINVSDVVSHLPSCLFSCQTLTSLNLSFKYATVLFPYALNLPALTNLSLKCLIFCAGDDGRVEPFSTLKLLNSLIIKYCKVRDAQNLCISSVTLVNLTMISCPYSFTEFKFELSTPCLLKFKFWGIPIQKLCGSNNNLYSTKHVDINVAMVLNSMDTPFLLLKWLAELANIESLIVSVLSIVPDLFKVEFPFLRNLKSLKVKLRDIELEQAVAMSQTEAVELGVAFDAEFEPFSFVPDGIIDFLIQNSPFVDVNIIDF